ncbi:mycothiol synthase [Desertimonas flava]|uniref:mycothiol synthase n=1 Tax=Desertimonas flava TaxID=2064846 RepID=UPI0013C48213|nr:mycothiol synthase [Desertimonas flava]
MNSVPSVIARAALADGFEPLSDQLAADIRDGVGTTIADEGGFVHVSPRADAWTMQVVVDPPARTPDRVVDRRLVAQALEHVAAAGGGRLDWWVAQPADADDDVAASAGFTVGRTLHQMRRPLPADERASVVTRPFRVGVDDAAWVTVNNRAFDGHPEQGNWTVETLRQRRDVDWFDPDGFRIHEVDGRIAAFCWTKVHPPAAGERDGEIYVIGVDPDFQGRGLGRQLTLAGLDWLSDHGIVSGLLYVDGDNAAALGLYHALGFTISRTDRAYVVDVPAPDAERTPS